MNPVKPMNQKRCPLNHCEWIHSSDGRCLWPGDWCPRRQERLLALWNQALHWTAEKSVQPPLRRRKKAGAPHKPSRNR